MRQGSEWKGVAMLSSSEILDIMNQTFMLALRIALPFLLISMILGIVVAIFQDVDTNMMILSMSACMAGAVCGDHCSPISDTTIMSSAGAQSVHINHVQTQLPYALLVAGVSSISYILAGFL